MQNSSLNGTTGSNLVFILTLGSALINKWFWYTFRTCQWMSKQLAIPAFLQHALDFDWFDIACLRNWWKLLSKYHIWIGGLAKCQFECTHQEKHKAVKDLSRDGKKESIPQLPPSTQQFQALHRKRSPGKLSQLIRAHRKSPSPKLPMLDAQSC